MRGEIVISEIEHITEHAAAIAADQALWNYTWLALDCLSRCTDQELMEDLLEVIGELKARAVVALLSEFRLTGEAWVDEQASLLSDHLAEGPRRAR